MVSNDKFTLKINDYIHSPEGKKNYNEEHFNEAARHYDFATRAMSLGQDMAWKRQLVESLPSLDQPICVDLACGTGDITFMLAEKYAAEKVVGIDLTEAMLELARKRNTANNVEFRRGDMGATELPDHYADIVTGSYAIRNAPDLKQALREIRPSNPAVLWLYSISPNPRSAGFSAYNMQS
jgi:demethylmenaquinone methyltransferase/2-methoxy-6-polyprenyl-1,4-benzoquinol methylase